jgi:hypothetical protein
MISVFKLKYKEVYYTLHPINKQPYEEVPGSLNLETHVVVGSFWYETDKFTGVTTQHWNFIPLKTRFKALGAVKSHRRRRGF